MPAAVDVEGAVAPDVVGVAELEAAGAESSLASSSPHAAASIISAVHAHALLNHL
ncbi:MAG: hypothetical protein AB7H92_08110 [Microbacteriaceae bacterium]